MCEVQAVSENLVALRGGVKRRRVECVGAAYLLYLNIKEHGACGNVRGRDGQGSEGREPVVLEDDVEYLRSLDPKEWKEQDHYAVLGLGSVRFNATEEDIKRAYRFKVLRHHPDKRRAQGELVRGDHDYFTCITKAYEILGIPSKRRSYDSVDPHFDDSLPTQSEVKKDFYGTFDKYFKLNSQWSEKKNVPELGNDNTPRVQVEKFYSFWYDFESWREYSYHDEEEKEKGQDREERRWIEKQNKAVRAKKKKEEMSRIRSLVDLAYNSDPRIVRFKQEDKDKKLAVKKARQDAAQARKAEEERIIQEEKLAKERAENEERAKIENLKAEKETMKKNMRKEKKTFREICKANNHYTTKDMGDSETVEHMAAVEKICEALKLLELQQLNKELSACKEGAGREVFLKACTLTEQRLEEERREVMRAGSGAAGENRKGGVDAIGIPNWTHELIQTLIKGVNCFPAGTNQRWEIIANFVNQHGTFQDKRRFTAKHVLSKAKDLQTSDFSKSSLKVAANQEAFDKFEKEKKKPQQGVVDDAGISVSFHNNNKTPIVNGNIKPQTEDAPWSKMEQELLEQAIKTYPVNTPERWDRIAECIPNRTKKDCMKRFKELVDLVKAKKQAAALAKK